jgi:two-component system OmpR family response regulator
MKILLVEDEAKIAASVLSGFQSAGFTTDYHADGNEGLAAALTTDYDAIVLDVMLP